MNGAVVDQIYEAALLPEKWTSTLEVVRAATQSASGGIIVYPTDQIPRGRATEVTSEGLDHYLGSGAWKQSRRHVTGRQAISGFLCANDFLSEAELARDPITTAFRAMGIGWQLGTAVPIANGDMAVFTFERWLTDGRHLPDEVATLNALRPHFARAGLMAARLGLQRALTSVATLQAVGLPGAVLAADGRVIASNALFDELQPTVVALARDRIAIAAAAADALFRDALARLAADEIPVSQSIPVPGVEDREPAVFHLLPLRRDARDIFDRAAILLVVTLVGQRSLPDLAVLASLFDLTPTEARLAADLTTGSTISDYASASGSSVATARTHLSNVFAKTGTDRQADLVALLSSVKRY